MNLVDMNPEQLKELRKHQIDIVTIGYDKAAAYANIIILGGYVGFFTIWSFTRDYLSQDETLWSALLMIVSISTFVIFEVYAMYIRSSDLIRMAKAADVDNKEYVELVLSSSERKVKKLPKVLLLWQITLTTCVLTGFSAVGIIGFAFVRQLLPDCGQIP